MRIRRTSRLILLDDHDRVFLFKVDDSTVFRPNDRRPSSVAWITPGGGLEEGESHEDAARRELWEETGIVGVEPGPLVAVCEPVLDWAGEIIQAHDRFYLTRLPNADVTLDNMTDGERGVYRDHRWWAIDDLKTTDERIIPYGLGDLIARIIAGDVPSDPVLLE
jgi:8-oxo-dGTP pyrophosphatase MutT (NUDIX family)